MSVNFTPGQTISQGDLDLYLTDSGGFAANAYNVVYAIFWVDPGPPEVEVLIGPAARIPVNPQIGEYYASLQVPPSAVVGTYRIRWTITQTAGAIPSVVVQEWSVISPGIVPVVYTPNVLGMINKLRVLLRDQCVGGEETIGVDAGGERIVVSLEELHDILKDCPTE